MIQNIIAASVPRQASALGIHLDLVETVTGDKVSKVLVKLERQYPGVGLSLIPVFFPAGFYSPENERVFWSDARRRREERFPSTGTAQSRIPSHSPLADASKSATGAAQASSTLASGPSTENGGSSPTEKVLHRS
jgi:hypothetical protein